MKKEEKKAKKISREKLDCIKTQLKTNNNQSNHKRKKDEKL